MSETYNNIKVKSGRMLRRQNRDSQQQITKAGSNDVDNQPGKVGQNNPIRNETGVPQPGQFQPSPNIFWGETLTVQIGGMGVGGVGMPPETPRSPIISVPFSPYPFSDSFRPRMLLNDPPPNPIGTRGILAGSNEDQPYSATHAGSIENALERTTSLDKDRPQRARESAKEILRRSLRGK
jgi:hypothetical protein